MTDEYNIYEKLTLGILKSLEKRPGVCNIIHNPKPPNERPNIVSWEQKYSCMMPDDLRNFYLTSNGFHLTWSTKINDHKVPLGYMSINPLERLLRIGAVGAIDPNVNQPSLADVELADHDEEDKSGTEILTPRFDHRSRIFELDPCEGHGKVCYVYRNTKPGIPAQKAEVWFLDRALQWHFLADSFIHYYRMMLVHLGLPQWQYSFTDIGLSPQAKQWFHLYCPIRLGLDGHLFVPTDETKSSTTTQVDVSKVFKGKSDKKKAVPPQNAAKRKQVSSAKGSGPGRLGPSAATVTKTFR